MAPSADLEPARLGVGGEVPEQVEVAGALVHDPGAVGGGGAGVEVGVVAVPAEPGAVGQHRVEVADPLVVRDEHDPLADPAGVLELSVELGEEPHEVAGPGGVDPQLGRRAAPVALPRRAPAGALVDAEDHGAARPAAMEVTGPSGSRDGRPAVGRHRVGPGSAPERLAGGRDGERPRRSPSPPDDPGERVAPVGEPLATSPPVARRPVDLGTAVPAARCRRPATPSGERRGFATGARSAVRRRATASSTEPTQTSSSATKDSRVPGDRGEPEVRAVIAVTLPTVTGDRTAPRCRHPERVEVGNDAVSRLPTRADPAPASMSPRDEPPGEAAAARPELGWSAPALFVIAAVAGLAYLSWPLGYLVNPFVAGHGLASDLEVPGQPFGWVFVLLDIVSGVLMVAIRAPRAGRRRSRFVPGGLLLGYAVFGLSSVLSAAVPLSCGTGRAALLACGTTTSTYGLHDVLSVVGYLAFFVSLAGVVRRRRITPTARATLIALMALGAAWSASGLAFMAVTLAHGPEVTVQHVLLALTSLAIAVVPVAGAVPASAPVVASRPPIRVRARPLVRVRRRRVPAR